MFKTPIAAKYTRLAGLLSPVARLFRNVKSGQKSSVACLRPRFFEMSTTEAPPYTDPGEDVVWDVTLKETLLTPGWQGAGFKFHETYVSLYTCLIINLRKKH